MNIYFFGGSFDPPHRGHLAIIQSCIEDSHRFGLIPVAQSPFKDQAIASPYQRICMLELLTEKLDPCIEIDDWEINQPGPSYTYETIRHLQKEYPENNLVMVMGVDQLICFDKWKNYEEIINSVQIAGFNRNQSNYIPPERIKICWKDNFQIDISSTSIRKKIAAGNLPVEDSISSVCQFIKEHNLYGCKL